MSAAHLSLNAVARALGGEVSGKSSVVCPGPGHTRKDRSLCVTLSAAAPDGFIVFSHAGDDWRACRDYVAGRLGVVARPSLPCQTSSALALRSPSATRCGCGALLGVTLPRLGRGRRGSGSPLE